MKFEEVKDIEEAEIRIGFERGDGSWSYVGRDVLKIGQTERTMNFGWSLSGDVDTALHEIGHTLGFPHEHQNPFKAGLIAHPPPFDKQGVRPAGGLSTRDRSWVPTFYPPLAKTMPTLVPYASVSLSKLGSGEQADFSVEPKGRRMGIATCRAMMMAANPEAPICESDCERDDAT